jgi:hypothetical protein
MRTTLTIDDDVLAAARSPARARSVPLGTVISELVRQGMKAPTPIRKRNGFPLFPVSEASPPITLDDLKRMEDGP